MSTDRPALPGDSTREDDRLAVARDIVRMFALERYTYLFFSAVSAVMVLAVAYQTITKPGVTLAELAGLLGSGGIVAFNIGRLLLMFNRVLEVVFMPSRSPGGKHGD